MDSSVTLFHLVRTFYQTMGISLSQSLNWRTSIFLSAINGQFVGVFGFIISRAETTLEYGGSLLGVTSTLYSNADFLITLWRIPEILHLIKMCENFIESSKCDKREKYSNQIMKAHISILGLKSDSTAKGTYSHLNEKIERTSAIFHFLAVKLTTAAAEVLPLITTLVNYYIYKMGDESYGHIDIVYV